MAEHTDLGKAGEEIAVQYLSKEGYTILVRNFIYDRAEIDIVAESPEGILVFVEVKTRHNDFFGDPEGFVSSSKIKQLLKAADGYLQENEWDGDARFDIIGIVKNKKEERLKHVKDAFYFFQ